MGKYTTVTAIYNTHIYNLTSSVVDATTVSYFIDDAESTIDGYVAKQYSLPFGSVPPLINKLAKDLSACYVLQYLYSQENQNVNDWVEVLCENTTGLLEQVRDDGVRLVYEGGTSVSMDINVNMGTNMEGVPLAFNVDPWLEQAVPGNLLDTISSEREAAK